MKVGDRIRIVGDHPHKGETGTVASMEAPSLSGLMPNLRGLIRIHLDDDDGGCYASLMNLRYLAKNEDPRI